jgi:HrpA-like RNA helicase
MDTYVCVSRVESVENNGRYVIDSGRAKEVNYDPNLRLSVLRPTWISRSAAKQRRGRAGRTREGSCYHLFSRHVRATLSVASTAVM